MNTSRRDGRTNASNRCYFNQPFPVKAYNRYLCALIEDGKAAPSFIVSHELPLDEAPNAYEHFDARDNGWTKVVLKPAT